MKSLYRGAARPCKQHWHKPVKHAGKTCYDHRGAKAASRMQMLAITLPDAAGVFKKQALYHLISLYSQIIIDRDVRNVLLIVYTICPSDR